MRWSLLVVVALLGCSGREPTPDQGLDAKPTPAERTRARAAQLLAPNHVLLGSGTKVGFAAARTLEGSGRVLEERLAVVGETATSWRVETRTPSLAVQQRSFPELEKVLLGLTVRKSDGAVTKAVAGAPGQPPVSIGLFPGLAATPEVAARDGVPEACTIALGTFDARRLDGQGTTTWTGTSGPTQDLVLKVDGEERYELAELPRGEALEVGAGTLRCRRTAYTNGVTVWVTDDEVVANLFGSPVGRTQLANARLTSTDATLSITERRTDATPRLEWPTD
jgi:hypothetical protein